MNAPKRKPIILTVSFTVPKVNYLAAALAERGLLQKYIRPYANQHRTQGRAVAHQQCKQRRQFKITTQSDHDSPVAPNLLEQQFIAQRPDAV